MSIAQWFIANCINADVTGKSKAVSQSVDSSISRILFERADSILSKCEVGLINYLSGIALSMAFIGIASTIGLLVLQVPLPFVNGFIAGISAFVPYLGAISSVVPPALLALLDSPWKAIEVLSVTFNG
ncbi:MAG: AI-2E family transporter [Kovacikia sp.]